MARKKREKARPVPGPAGRDYLLQTAEDNWPYILAAYQRFEDKKPIVLYDIQEARIYVYPYPEFKADLSERSQRSLEEQYEAALRDNKVVVFVRDNEQRRLVSFSMDLA
jgi:hypothetical protein